jgi:N-acyl-L-homoserine lactone synthetase
MDAMFRNRASVFSERLGWEVTVKDGRERDVFDDENPLYLISVDPYTGAYWGSLRLLPTTGPNMLRDEVEQFCIRHGLEGASLRAGLEDALQLSHRAPSGLPGPRFRRH